MPHESGFGRNSHIPACLECRLHQEKCSKTRPTCVQCSQSSRECIYSSKTRRTPLTREYLTDVENRLQILENALGKLFPSGELDDVTRSLLADETPRDQDSLTQSFIDTNESTLKDFLQEPGPTALENALDDSQINTDYDLTGVGPEGQHLSLEAFSSKDNSPNDLLASAEKEKEFADTYFSRYHKLYPFVHEATFRLEFQDRLLSPSSQSVLANMILAFGSWLAPENHSDLGVQYYRKAQQHLGQIALTDNESITMVQALLLLSDFAQKNGDPDESWQYVATAVRKAISLNLHVELTDPGLTALDREIRRRIWWATYCAESCSARIYGRPLVLPEDGLITVRPVTNTPNQNPTSPTASFPVPTDDPTIYSGLIQQSNYHRMANDIYRRVLSSPTVTPQLVNSFEKMIQNWHSDNPAACARLVSGSMEQWKLTAWRRQFLCDQSLHLLIHRPLLLQWLQNKDINKDTALPAEEHAAEAQCRAAGLAIARETIAQISESIMEGTYDKMTLAFTLHVLFHALLVPVILIKGDRSSPKSISYIQDVERAKSVMEYLSVEGDTLSKYFVTVLDRLFAVARQSTRHGFDQGPSRDDLLSTKRDGPQTSNNNIFW